MKKLLLVLGLTLTLVTIVIFLPKGVAQASPPLQMTPGTDPMSMPTVQAPVATPQPASLGATMPMTGTTGCPMLSGSGATMGSMGMMGNMGSMGSMGGMMGGMPMQTSGITGTMPMNSQMGGMGMMGSMGSMGNMGSMGTMPMNGQMGSMPMNGAMPMGTTPYVNDVLSNQSSTSWFYSTNPWWVLGWMLVFGLMIAVLALAIVALVRLLRKPAAVAVSTDHVGE